MVARTRSAGRRHRGVALLILACTFTFGCHLLVDVADHHLRADTDAGAADDGADPIADTSSSTSDGAVGDADAQGDADAPDVKVPWTVIASGQQSPNDLRVDTTSIYWVNEAKGASPGSINRVDKTGGAVTVLAPNRARPVGVRYAGSELFFTDDLGEVGVFRVPKVGGAVTPVEKDGLGAGTLAVGNPFLYSEAWAPNAAVRIRRSSTSGDGSAVGCYPYVAASTGGRIRQILTDGTHIYFIDAGEGAIMRMDPSGGCSAGAIVFAPNQPQARSIIADSIRVYWVTSTSVLRQDKTQIGGQPTVITNTGTSFSDLTGLNGAVAATDEGAGTLIKVNVGSPPVVLAYGQGGPRGLVDDGTTMFWTNHTSGEIVRMEIPP